MWAGLKLETPIALALPASRSRMNVFQVETNWSRCGERPVDEQQVHVVEAEPLERPVKAGDRAVVTLVRRRRVSS